MMIILCKKMRFVNKKRILLCGVIVVAVIVLLHPNFNGHRSYEYIAKENILSSLHEETAENFSSSAVIECDYRDIVYGEISFSINLIDGDLMEGHRIRDGGEYAPLECRPKYSAAIIVPYRDRPEQLRGFLVYMHTFFRRQKLHYRIFIVEQVDSRPFNRAKLMNIGAVYAIKMGFPCLIFHDVDLLPLKLANLYACTKLPRHMSSSINKFRFVLPYLNLFGGAVSITARDYRMINGMSNEFFGWGGEDDDLYSRLQALDIKICRFEPETSQYHKIKHNVQVRGERRKKHGYSKSKISSDGLTSLKFTEVATVLHPLFTHIMVDL